MAPREHCALKSSRSSATHLGSRWMKVHFQWRQTCIVKNWTNKTIEKRAFRCLWMHCYCLRIVWHGFTLYQATDEVYKCMGVVESHLSDIKQTTYASSQEWHCQLTHVTAIDAKKKRKSITVTEFSNWIANKRSAVLHLRLYGSLSAHTLSLINHLATLKGLTLWIIHSTNVHL